jgi:hypothetical protein
MEIILAKKLSEMELNELIRLLMKLKIEDFDSFRALQEVIEDF